MPLSFLMAISFVAGIVAIPQDIRVEPWTRKAGCASRGHRWLQPSVAAGLVRRPGSGVAVAAAMAAVAAVAGRSRPVRWRAGTGPRARAQAAVRPIPRAPALVAGADTGSSISGAACRGLNFATCPRQPPVGVFQPAFRVRRQDGKAPR